MTETTDIEKKSLEAHVELCAERYRHLETKLETVESKITGLDRVIREIHDMLAAVKDKHSNQLMNWSFGLIGLLTGIVGYLLAVFVIK